MKINSNNLVEYLNGKRVKCFSMVEVKKLIKILKKTNIKIEYNYKAIKIMISRYRTVHLCLIAINKLKYKLTSDSIQLDEVIGMEEVIKINNKNQFKY